MPLACVCARAPLSFAPPPRPGRCGARTTRGPGAGRWQGRSRRFVPLRVSCPGPVLCLVCSGGVAWSLRPFAWLVVARPLVGGPVRPGRSGAWGVLGGGGAVAAPPGGVFWSGSVGGSRGARGGGFLSLGLFLCLPHTGTNAGFVGVALFMEGVVCILLRFMSVRSCLGAVRGGRCGAPLCTDGWLAGRLVAWLAPQLAEVTVGTGRAGDGPGACGVWALWPSASGAAVLPGGRAFLAWRGGTGLMSPSRPPASRGWGGGRPRWGSAVPLSPFGPPVLSPGGCGGWLEGPGPGPPHG